FMIVWVFTDAALYQIGWAGLPEQAKSSTLKEMFTTNRCGYAFPVTCLGLGLGMAMMTNRLRASTVWPEFLDRQSAVTSLTQAVQVARDIVKLSLSYAWPIVLMTSLFAALGLAIMQGTDPKAWHLNGTSAGEVLLG